MNNDYNGFINEIYAGGIREFFAGGSSADFPALLCVAGGLLILAVMLLTALYVLRNHTVRIYNWNGKRYCYLGRARLYRESGRYRVCIGERMADLSYTTLYQLCLPRRFVRRHRYKEMVLSAGKARCVLPVDDCMRQSVYYREALVADLEPGICAAASR